MLLDGDEKMTFIEGSVRQSIGPALFEAAIAREGSGAISARVQAVARIGSTSISSEALMADGFIDRGPQI